MTMQRIGRIGAIPSDVMDVRVRSPIGRKLAWWAVAGKTCVAAYQPKGAASLAASYTNLVNPGTYDAAPGVAPTLTADGWTFNGTTEYLTTGVTIPSSTQTPYSFLLRFSAATSWPYPFGFLCGCLNASSYGFCFGSYFGVVQFFNGNSVSSTGASSGTYGIAGNQAFENGTAHGGAIAVSGTAWTDTFFIGCRSVGGTPNSFIAFKAQAFAIYSDTLTAGEVAAVSAAMSLL